MDKDRGSAIELHYDTVKEARKLFDDCANQLLGKSRNLLIVSYMDLARKLDDVEYDALRKAVFDGRF